MWHGGVGRGWTGQIDPGPRLKRELFLHGNLANLRAREHRFRGPSKLMFNPRGGGFFLSRVTRVTGPAERNMAMLKNLFPS